MEKNKKPQEINISGVASSDSIPTPTSIASHGTESNKNKITIIGSGQVAATIAALISKLKTNSEGLVTEVEGKRDDIEVSVLGRKVMQGEVAQDSPSIAGMKQGFTLKYKSKSSSDVKELAVTPDDVFFASDYNEIINRNGKQDHIIITTKATDYNQELLSILLGLRKEVSIKADQNTTFMIAHNGNPGWFVPTISDFLPGKKKTNRDLFGELGEIADSFLENLGPRNIVGCVLNLACNFEVNADNTPNYQEYRLSTPLDKVHIPIYNIDAEQGSGTRKNLRALQGILDSSGIQVGMSQLNLGYELLLKMQVNSAINGICAITGKTVGEVLDDRGLKNVVLALATEVNKYAQKIGYDNLRDATRLMARLESSRSHYPSMERDFQFGKTMEIDAIYSNPTVIANSLTNNTTMMLMENTATILRDMQLRRDTKLQSGEQLANAVTYARGEVQSDLVNLVRSARLMYRPPSPVHSSTPSAAALENRNSPSSTIESPTANNLSSQSLQNGDVGKGK